MPTMAAAEKRSMLRLFRWSAVLLAATLIWTASAGAEVTVTTRTGGQIQAAKLYSAYYALVIGCSEYTNGWPPLPNALKDARQVAAALDRLGWQTELLANPTWSQLRRALNRLVTGPGRDPDRAILVWYSGHGHTLDEADGTALGYIVPVDAPRPGKDEFGFVDRAIDMRQVETVAKRIASKHVLMMFDSCFSGAIFTMVRAAPSEFIEEKTSLPVRQFITAGNQDESVPDRSVFKTVFIGGIQDGFADRNRDGYVTGEELGSYLQEKVVNYSRKAQHPQYGKINNPALDKGDFVFVLPTKKSAPPTTAAPRIAKAVAPQVVAAKPTTGRVRLTANVSGAKFKLAGQEFTTDSRQELIIAPVPSGRHRLTARLEGYADWRGQVEVKTGQTADLRIEMPPNAPPGPTGEAAAIKALLEKQLEYWKAGDADAALAAFSDDAVVMTGSPRGIITLPFDKFRRAIKAQLAADGPRMVIDLIVSDLITVHGDRAVALAEFSTYYAGGTTRRALTTYYLAKRQGRWKITRRELNKKRSLADVKQAPGLGGQIVRDFLSRVQQAWNDRDHRRLLSYYSSEAEITIQTSYGPDRVNKRRFGRAAPLIMARMKASGGRMEFLPQEPIEVKNGRCTVRVKFMIKTGDRVVRRGEFTYHLVEGPSGWLIARREMTPPPGLADRRQDQAP